MEIGWKLARWLGGVWTASMLLAAGNVLAKDIYVSQSGSGSTNSLAWLNNLGNWGNGATQVAPGDTVRLLGMITSALTIQGSGSAGNPITLLFESGAKFSAATWSGNIITVVGKTYIIIDGGGNGVIEATNNGSDKTYKNTFVGVYLNNSQNCEVRNLTLQNFYHRTQNSSDTTSLDGIVVSCGGSMANNLIHNNKITWVANGIKVVFPNNGGPISIYSNTCQYVSTGIIFGSENTSVSFSGVDIYGNDISDAYVWDSPSNTFHHDGIHFWGYGPNVTGLKVHDNYVHGNWGVNFTCQLYFEGQATDYLVYNNILTAPIRHIYTKLPGPGKVYNNTLVNSGAAMDSLTGCVVDFANNILYGTSGMCYNGNAGSNPNVTVTDSLTVNPLFVNAAAGDYHIQMGSPAIRAGENLYSAFITDRDGNPRPSSGPWTIGAFEAQTQQVNKPAPPSGLRIGGP